eukprot:GHVN01073940.1.p1 GENE.GHVN01073940.1~~GHVN01073940.1.p1  ORF type:complete len:370 (+),score=37.34 GHVN01073940.1:62-1171(+)
MKDPITLPTIGFGCVRLSGGQTDQNKKGVEALEVALRGGVTLIETSPIYGDGSTEDAVAAKLTSLIQAGDLKRDEVKIMSKFGLIQGSALQRKTGFQFPATTTCNAFLKHCIHPEFMQDQLTRSLRRLKCSYIDIYLIQSPEYYLQKVVNPATSSEADVTKARNEVLRRIEQTFEALEIEVQRTGRIRGYGVCSETFNVPASHPYHLPYDGLYELAEAAACRVSNKPKTPTGFVAVQFSANLVETDALRGVLPWARDCNIATLITRPLNAFNPQGGQKYLLAESKDVSEQLAVAEGALVECLTSAKFIHTSKMIEVVRKILSEVIDLIHWDKQFGLDIVPQIRLALTKDGPHIPEVATKIQVSFQVDVD